MQEKKKFKIENKNDFINVLKNIDTSNDDIIPIIRLKLDDGSFQFYTLRNDDKIDELINTIENDLTSLEIIADSKYLINSMLVKGQIDEVTLFYLNKRIKKRKSEETEIFRGEGNFFKWYHKYDKFDLTKYQIYKKDEEISEDNCLIHSLIMSKLFDVNEIELIRNIIKTEFFPRKELQKVAKLLNCKIRVYEQFSREQYTYGEINSEKFLELGLIENHYFLNEKTNITPYALENYNKIKHLKDFNKIETCSNGKYKKTNKKFITSYKLIKYLIENKDNLLIKINRKEINKRNIRINQEFTFENLEYNEDNLKCITFKERELKYDNIIFFDFETDTKRYECNLIQNNTKIKDKEEKIRKINELVHQPYLIHYQNYNINNQYLINEGSYVGYNCAKNFLLSINQDSYLIAHNCRYDINFIIKFLFNIKPKERNGSFICYDALFYNNITKKTIKLKFLDSFKMIPEKLDEFGEMFKLDVKKEIMPYDIYNSETIKKTVMPIEESKKYLSDEDFKQFLNNIEEWDLRINSNFKHIEYAKKYCRMDVETLAKGYFKFRKWMLSLTDDKLDIITYPTLSSFADNYLIYKNCYDECYFLNGISRAFIQQCIVGGRTMVQNNTKIEVKDTIIQALDGRSLYCSAMNRIGYELGGFLKGKPKVLKNDQLNMEFLNKCDAYFIEIDLLEINKHYNFPLISCKNKEGIRNFRNNLIGKHFVDKITLEDYIKFHNIKFQIIKGYYFNEGRNQTITKIAFDLYQTRLKKKQEGNPIQLAYKLIMNSSYGATILKPDPHEIKIICGEEDSLKYIIKNNNYVESFIKIKESNMIKIKSKKTINDHENRVHIGCEILSMSKRIMSEVMCLADDIKIPIYYQDTDSMHIDNDKIDILAKEFKLKYNRELIGDNLGQFHCDFDYKCDRGTTPICVHGIYLGKKSYYEKVLCILEGKEVYVDHFRLKGIPEKTIRGYSKDEKKEIEDIYKSLYNGIPKKFDISKHGVRFIFNSNYTITNKQLFERSIKF